MNRRKRAVAALVAVGLALAGFQVVSTTAAGDEVSEARASAFGVSLAGPVPVDALPQVAVKVPPGRRDSAEDALVEVPSNPLATSFTARVESDAAIDSVLAATLASVSAAQAGGLPARWNSRGYAVVEDLEALTDLVTADVVESEATVSCSGRRPVMATATRVADLRVGGTEVPLIGATPNEVVFDQMGIRIVFWETNWDPDGGGTTDGSATVFANALHITAPAGVDLVVSHAEAGTGKCVSPGRPREAPPAQPVPGAPTFTG